MKDKIPPILRKRAGRLPACYEFFNGLRSLGLEMPDNLIVFHRPIFSMREQIRRQHHRFVLILNLKTTGHLCLNEKTIRLPEGHALLIFPHQFHHCLTINVPLCWLYITFELPAYGHLMKLYNTTTRVSRKAFDLIGEVLALYLARRRRTGTANEMALSVALLLNELLKLEPHHRKMHVAADSGTFDRPVSFLIEQVNRYIHTHLARRLTNASLARALGISSSHLRFSFRKQVKMSLGKYIKNIKIHKAIELLTQTDKRIKEIAALLGYSSLASFGQMFKHEMGLSPVRYRRAQPSRPSPATKTANR